MRRIKNILLIEPDYKNKYPPLGLMKISTYHKNKGDNVVFCKGNNRKLQHLHWDRIYITTLFTFYWKKTLETIDFYKNSVQKISDIFCGGVLATVLQKELHNEYDITILPGLLDRANILGKDNIVVDTLPPDYSIIDTTTNSYLNYEYPIRDAYISYATRGCIRRCSFCAVPIIEPTFQNYIDIKEQVHYIKNHFGEKKDLMLLDNNVLASRNFEEIINDIKSLGFQAGAKLSVKKNNRISKTNRYVDFNQGIDARLLTREKCRKLSEIAIKPLRIAFDNADPASISLYKSKTRLAAEYGITNLSNYILFNFEDSPEDFYRRLKINILLNEEFERKGYKTKIWSFPMKYSPINGQYCLDRKFVGAKWTKKYLRAIQCILNATHGVVGTKKDFFYIAFGRNLNEFYQILCKPESHIINRCEYERNGLAENWLNEFQSIHGNSKTYRIIMNNDFKNLSESNLPNNFLRYYL